MKYCPFCSASIKNEAKFCPHCGERQTNKDEVHQVLAKDKPKVQKKIVNSRSQNASVDQQHERSTARSKLTQESVHSQLKNIDRQQVADEARNYFEFIKRQVLCPSFEVENESYYGLANILVMLALAFFGLREIIKSLIPVNSLPGIGDATADMGMKFLSEFFSQFALYSAIFILSHFLIVVAIEKMYLHKNISVFRLANRIFGPLSFVLVLELLGLLLALLGTSYKITLALTLSFLVIVPFAVLGYLCLYLTDENKRYHLILLVTIATMMIDYYLIKSFIFKFVMMFIQKMSMMDGLKRLFQ